MRYFVDWSDPPFPEIRSEKHALRYEEDLKTFGECKRDIIEHFERRIKDARQQIADVRSLRVKDVL